MTAAVDTSPPRTSPVPAILLTVLALGVAIALLASLNTVLPSLISWRSASAQPAVSTAEAALPSDAIHVAGSVLDIPGWRVAVGELQWGQTASVYAAKALNPLVTPGWEWVLLPVELTSTSASGAEEPALDVTLSAGVISMSHHDKSSKLYPTSTLPYELDERTVPPGETRSGQVGWMVPSSARDAGTCVLKVKVAGTTSFLACNRLP